MHAFDVPGDPLRRRILELLAEGEYRSGEIAEVIQKEFGITQAAVSHDLRVLRENGFAQVRRDGPRRIYTVDTHPSQEVDGWFARFACEVVLDDGFRVLCTAPMLKHRSYNQQCEKNTLWTLQYDGVTTSTAACPQNDVQLHQYLSLPDVEQTPSPP
ncbi:hypothetical protein BH24GEM3_BH24GEM3_11590 [soil metagenome]